jgi:hypothetical protein
MARELGLTERATERMMSDLKDYMNKKIFKILEDMHFPADQMGSAAASMAYALGSLSMEDYFSAMSTAFSGGEIDALNDFINDYEYTLPDTAEIGN